MYIYFAFLFLIQSSSPFLSPSNSPKEAERSPSGIAIGLFQASQGQERTISRQPQETGPFPGSGGVVPRADGRGEPRKARAVAGGTLASEGGRAGPRTRGGCPGGTGWLPRGCLDKQGAGAGRRRGMRGAGVAARATGQPHLLAGLSRREGKRAERVAGSRRGQAGVGRGQIRESRPTAGANTSMTCTRLPSTLGVGGGGRRWAGTENYQLTRGTGRPSAGSWGGGGPAGGSPDAHGRNHSLFSSTWTRSWRSHGAPCPWMPSCWAAAGWCRGPVPAAPSGAARGPERWRRRRQRSSL